MELNHTLSPELEHDLDRIAAEATAPQSFQLHVIDNTAPRDTFEQWITLTFRYTATVGYTAELRTRMDGPFGCDHLMERNATGTATPIHLPG